MKKERFVDWWKQDKRYMTLLKAVLMALLPLLCCLVRTAAEGRSIGQVYLPSSEWNDELFYFKQVEGIVNYGFPRGYFGFNESHALQLSFAAWSPVLVFPWILWGLLFGWNLLSPVICNIVLLTITMFVFVWLVKPTWKQLGILTVLFSLYSLFVRYMLSGMPEVICFSLLILFYGLAMSYLKKESRGETAGGMRSSFLRRAFCAVCGIFCHACGTGRPPGDAEHADPAVIPLYDLSRGSQRPCGG